jgi:3-hydroxybutyryl-CoA dehydratase
MLPSASEALVMSFTEHHLFFDDVTVGQEWKSLGRTVTQADIVNFAGISGDFNPIHMDHEFAKSTPFQQPIAHGLLIFSIASGLGLFNPAMRTLAFMSIREWHFRDPVHIGDTIHVCTKVLEILPRARGRRGVITWQKQLVNQAARIVQEGIVVTMVQGRAAMEGAGSDPGQPTPAN